MRRLRAALGLLAGAWLFSACADPAAAPDAGAVAGVVEPDAGVVEPDAGPPPEDAGLPPDASLLDAGPGPRRVQARGLVPVLGVSSNARRTVRARVNSPTVGSASNLEHVVRTTPAPR